MTVNFLDFVLMAVLVVVGCALTYVGLWLALRSDALARQKATDAQLGELARALKALEVRIEKLTERPSTPSPVVAPVVAPAAVVAEAPRRNAEAAPDILVVLAAAVTAFLGKRVRVRSAKQLQSPYEIVNPWSQQGRVVVQASHNLRLRR